MYVRKKKSTKKIKGLFAKKEKAETAPWGASSKSKLDIDKSPPGSPGKPRSFVGGDDEDSPNTKDRLSFFRKSGSPEGTPGTENSSPKRTSGKPKLKLPFGGGKKDKKKDKESDKDKDQKKDGKKDKEKKEKKKKKDKKQDT